MCNLAILRQSVLVAAPLVLSLGLCGEAHAKNTASVRVVNPETSPVPVRDVDHPGSRPFSKLLCLSDIPSACDASLGRPALPASFEVPETTASSEPVRHLVVEFVSGTCVGTGRSTFIEVRGTPPGPQTEAATGDNFSSNRFPLAPAQSLPAAGVNGAQAMATAARMYFEPGTTISMSFDFALAGQLACRMELNGHFVVD